MFGWCFNNCVRQTILNDVTRTVIINVINDNYKKDTERLGLKDSHCRKANVNFFNNSIQGLKYIRFQGRYTVFISTVKVNTFPQFEKLKNSYEIRFALYCPFFIPHY